MNLTVSLFFLKFKFRLLLQMENLFSCYYILKSRKPNEKKAPNIESKIINFWVMQYINIIKLFI